MSAAQRHAQRRMRLFVIFTFVLLLAYSRQLLSSPTAGQDFRAFYAAATLAAHAADPYDWSALGRTENGLYNAAGRLRPGDPTYYDFLPYPEGPWLALALEPLTGLPWQVGYAVFASLMLLAIAAGSWLILSRLGWRGSRRSWAVAMVALSPIAFFNVFQGQASALVFIGLAAGWALAGRRHPVLAGVALTLVWVKPNLGIALPLVVALLEPQRWRTMLLAFAASSAAAIGMAELALPGVTLHWANELLSHWRSVQGVQPDVASLHSFYYPLLSGRIKTLALAVVLSLGIGYAAWAWRRCPTGQHRALTMLLLWFAWLPYVHSFDAILLLPVLAVLVGPDLRGWQDPLTEVTLWAFAIVPFAYFVGLHLGSFNGFAAVPIALLVLAWHRRFLAGRPAQARTAPTSRELAA